MKPNPEAFARIATELFQGAERQGRTTLLESEAYRLLAAGGLATPCHYTLPVADGAAPGAQVHPRSACGTGHQVHPSSTGGTGHQVHPLSPGERGQGEGAPEPAQLPGDRVVLKVESPRITHKTEMGGVRIVANTPAAIAAGASEILASVRSKGGDALAATVSDILVAELIRGEPALGGQILAGLRFAHDMGPVVTLGFGGLDAEEMSRALAGGQGSLIYSPVVSSIKEALRKLGGSFAGRLLTGKTRSARPLVSEAELVTLLSFFDTLTREFSGRDGLVVEDFEVNPFLVADGKLVAVDAFVRFARREARERTCDLEKVSRLLTPKTAAVLGASSKGLNVGRIILRNLLRDGFPSSDIRVIRDDCDTIDNVACTPSINDLPWKADIMVVAVAAAQVPQVVSEAVTQEKASSMVLIPGGMGETEAGREADRKARELLETAARVGRAPVIVGPNCLGIRSRPGRYDTLFIPESKLPLPENRFGKVALVCQSGALMITRMNALPFIDPAYAISTGNQMDLTVTDFVEHLLTRDEVNVIVLYVEGFKEMDGLRLARLIQRGRKQGRRFIVYRAGRTAEGITATSSHTASISGDFVSCAEILKDAGALLATSLDEMKAHMQLAALLEPGIAASVRSLGLISNAGFETVGMADNVDRSRGFTVPALAAATTDRIRATLKNAGIDALVNVRNPLDLTPMANDRVLADCLAAYLDDPGIGAVVMGFVPLTPAMKTLPPGTDPSGRDSIADPVSLPNVLPALVKASKKPVVTVVDGGAIYDPLARALQAHGIPCLRSADFAVRVFQAWMENTSAHPPGSLTLA